MAPRPTRFPALVFALLAALPLAATAQIDEVVVTTRKRAENLQEVPIAINALSAEEIERKQITSLDALSRNLSSVEFDEGTSRSDTRITVRGLSPTRGRQNVAVLVDGIDVSTEAISNSGGGVLLNTRLVDIERIEVVKGPQLALYGRSAFAGAIQYVTKDPSDVFEASVSADANVEDQYSGTLSLSGPVLGDALGLRLNAAWWDEQGFYDNALTGESLGDDKGYGLALTAKSALTDSLTLKFRAEFQDQQIAPAATQFLPFNAETLVPESARTPLSLGGDAYPAIFRCFEQIAAKTYNAGLDARNARVYDPRYVPTGPAPGVLYSSPYCETAVATFEGAADRFDENRIAVSPNPFTDQDYEGVDRQLLRFSLVADWQLERGTLSSRTGYIHEDAAEEADNGKFGYPVLDPSEYSPLTGSGYRNANVNAFAVTTDKLTTQFSQELLYRTEFDGPAQVSIGGLYWREGVGNDSTSLTIQASGSHCAWASLSGVTFDDLGFSEPGTGCYGYSERAVAPLLRGGFNFADGSTYDGIGEWLSPSPADRDTEHRSLFGMLEYEVTDTVKLTFEGRYNVETVKVTGPQFLDPDASGGPGSWVPCGPFFRPCTDAYLFGPTGPFYSRANFTSPLNVAGIFGPGTAGGSGYDIWSPDYVYTRGPRAGTTYRDAIPEVCQSDPKVQQRLAEFDDTGTDRFDLFNPYCVTSISRDDQWFAPKLTLDWQATDDLKLYASWARAEKPGGFSTLSIGSSGLNRELLEFEPEMLTVYEGGWKSQWLDRTLVFNGAVFFQDFTDKQTLVSVLNAAGDRLVNKLLNVDGAEVLGTELELSWAPDAVFLGGTWQLSGAYTWLDAEYKKAIFPNNSPTFIAAAGNCDPVLVTALNGTESVICNVSLDGKKLEDAPEDKFVGSLHYRLPVAEGVDLIAEADASWTAKRFIEATNENWVEADTNVDLRLGLAGEHWEVMGYVTNVFDDDTITSVLGGPSLSCCFILGSGIDVSGVEPPAANPAANEPGKTVTVELPQFRAAFAPDPRVVGMQVRYRFGE